MKGTSCNYAIIQLNLVNDVDVLQEILEMNFTKNLFACRKG